MELVIADDLAHDSFAEALEGAASLSSILSMQPDTSNLNARPGVDGVIHAAAPLPGRSASPEEALEVCSQCPLPIEIDVLTHLIEGLHRGQPEYFATNRAGGHQEFRVY